MISSSQYEETDISIFFDANIKKMAEELDLIRRSNKHVYVRCMDFDFMDDVERYIAAGANVEHRPNLRRLS